MNQTLIGIEKLLSESWNAVTKDWKPTLGWTLGILFVPFLLNIVFALPQIAEPELAKNIVYQCISIILIWAASLYFQTGLIRYFLNDKKEVSVTVQDIVGLAWIGILMTIILIPAFILFILPGIWLAVAFSMAMPIYLKEGKGGWQALKSSYEMIKGRWWATLIRFLVPNLVYNIGFGVIFGIIVFAFVAIGSIAASGFIYALEQGADQSQALAALGPVAMIGLPLGVLLFIVLAIAAGIILTIAQTSIWTNLYKSLAETKSK